MSIQPLTRDLLHTSDAIELPSPGVPVEAEASRHDRYTIVVTRSPTETLDHLLKLIAGANVALITDQTVAELHGPALLKALERRGRQPGGDRDPGRGTHKTPHQALELLDWLTGTQLARTDVIVTFGGGVVIDMGGWVASAYMRGVPYVNLPTTLVGQVDAGIGGKLAVNHPVAKNLIGGFAQPGGVLSDVSLPADARPPPAASRPRRVDQEGDHRLARLLGPDRGLAPSRSSRATSTRSSGSCTERA